MQLKKIVMVFLAATLLVSALTLGVFAETEEAFEVGVAVEAVAPISSSPVIIQQGEEL